MKVEKINVNLYGGKSIFKGVKETPLEAEIKIKINDKMTCEITDNNQVDENTEFAD